MAGVTEEELAEPQPLTEALMDLSNIGRIVNENVFQYRSLSCVSKRLGPIKAIEAYTCLLHVDLSRNSIKDIAPLKGLKSLVALNLSFNEVVNLKQWDVGEEDGPAFPHLAQLNLRRNSLAAMPALKLPALRAVNLAENQISSCQDFGGHERLTELDLSQNKLDKLAGLGNMPALEKLKLSGNESLASFEGLVEVPALVALDASNTNMTALDAPWQDLQALRKLNVSGCQLASPKPLEALRQMPKLESLWVAGNPFLESSSRAEVLVCHWRLTSIDDAAVSGEELEQARLLCVQQLEEERRLKAEAEAAAEAEG